MSENTEDLEARIAAYIDGQLPPAEAARLEVFLANTDPRLAEQIIGMLNDRHRLRTLPRPAAPLDLAGRIMEQVERATLLNDTHSPDHETPHRWWQSRAAIAAGFLLMIGGFSYFVFVAVIGGGGSQTRQIVTSTNPEKPPASTPAPVASAMKATAPASRNADADVAAIASARGSGDHAAFAVNTGDSALKVPGEKEIEKAEKVEQVVSEQLVRNREVLQNGQPVASKLGYANVESPVRALAHIAANSSPSSTDPVVVTFVAHDERDFTRLRAALEDILNQDHATALAQTALHNKYRYNITNITRRNAMANGNYQFWDAANRGFDAAPDETKAEIAKESAAASNGQAASTAPAAPAAQAPAVNTAAQIDKIADNGPLYRVALRQEQLVQLANQFRVDSITCGRQAYRITPDNYDYQLARAKDKTDDLDDKPEKVLPDGTKKGADEPLATVPAGPPAPEASPAPANIVEQRAAAASQENQTQQKASTNVGNAGTLNQTQSDNEPAFKPAAWIECIITMEQAPAQATRPASTDPASPLTK
jgi:anti-sigma factor RsiW